MLLIVKVMAIIIQNVKGKRVGLAKLRAGVSVNAGSLRISQKGLAYFCRNSRLAAGRVEA